ncbi:hypothetical protein SCUP515_09952 [Seiridium cupressi]
MDLASPASQPTQLTRLVDSLSLDRAIAKILLQLPWMCERGKRVKGVSPTLLHCQSSCGQAAEMLPGFRFIQKSSSFMASTRQWAEKKTPRPQACHKPESMWHYDLSCQSRSMLARHAAFRHSDDAVNWFWRSGWLSDLHGAFQRLGQHLGLTANECHASWDALSGLFTALPSMRMISQHLHMTARLHYPMRGRERALQSFKIFVKVAQHHVPDQLHPFVLFEYARHWAPDALEKLSTVSQQPGGSQARGMAKPALC